MYPDRDTVSKLPDVPLLRVRYQKCVQVLQEHRKPILINVN